MIGENFGEWSGARTIEHEERRNRPCGENNRTRGDPACWSGVAHSAIGASLWERVRDTGSCSDLTDEVLQDNNRER